MENYKIGRPKKNHLTEIEKWLKEENEKSQNEFKGFYCNWEYIYKDFTEKKMIIITNENNFPIGFLTYSTEEFHCSIDFMEIHPNERGKNFGKTLINYFLKSKKEKKTTTITLTCNPKKSELFWGKMGFMKYPNPINDRIMMFKSLIPTLEPNKGKTKSNIQIKLWNCTLHEAERDNVKPHWIWDINLKKDKKTLSKPIIFPTYKDYKIELTINDKSIEKCKVKYFPLNLTKMYSFVTICCISESNNELENLTDRELLEYLFYQNRVINQKLNTMMEFMAGGTKLLHNINKDERAYNTEMDILNNDIKIEKTLYKITKNKLLSNTEKKAYNEWLKNKEM